MKLTTLERRAIQGILDSEYGDGDVDKCVWTWSANRGFPNKRSFSGAISSLVKKGYVIAGGDGRDATLTLTQSGFDAFRE